MIVEWKIERWGNGFRLTGFKLNDRKSDGTECAHFWEQLWRVTVYGFFHWMEFDKIGIFVDRWFGWNE
jgi:hypothetical protein